MPINGINVDGNLAALRQYEAEQDYLEREFEYHRGFREEYARQEMMDCEKYASQIKETAANDYSDILAELGYQLFMGNLRKEKYPEDSPAYRVITAFESIVADLAAEKVNDGEYNHVKRDY